MQKKKQHCSSHNALQRAFHRLGCIVHSRGVSSTRRFQLRDALHCSRLEKLVDLIANAFAHPFDLLGTSFGARLATLHLVRQLANGVRGGKQGRCKKNQKKKTSTTIIIVNIVVVVIVIVVVIIIVVIVIVIIVVVIIIAVGVQCIFFVPKS